MARLDAPQVLITPLKPALILGMAQKLPVLVRVQAPDADPARQPARKPYHLALVIDRSGSMSGAPLQEAVRCAQSIVDRLQPTDRAALVVFDDRVKMLAPVQPVGDRRALHQALAQIRAGGSTNLHGGWQAGVGARSPDGVPIAFQDAALMLQAVSPPAWDALLADPLVLSRQAELAAGRFLERARAAPRRATGRRCGG